MNQQSSAPEVRIHRTDVAVVGGGGAGLRAAIAASQAHPELDVTVISKVYPLRSHTVAAEGGAAGVIDPGDSHAAHIADTLSSGEGLCDPDVVAHVVSQAPRELARLERWGCPWSRTPDGEVATRRFGGMSQPRTWFAADRTGLHLLRTLLQTSVKLGIQRLDDHLVLDLLAHDGRVGGLLAHSQRDGETVLIEAGAVILATGGAGRAFQRSTNSAQVTGDGIAMAYRAGLPLRDMEMVQYHPTAILGSGTLITEACRGEGAVLRNASGHRYLADYGLGPVTPVGRPEPRRMELGPRDRLSQAFWHESQAGRTVPGEPGEADSVHLDLRHLGEDVLRERLPQTLQQVHRRGLNPLVDLIPVSPAVHYTMGGIATHAPNGDGQAVATGLAGLYAAGECASSGLHGANRLGSNSLTEILVLGRAAGLQAGAHAVATSASARPDVRAEARERAAAHYARLGRGSEAPGAIRRELGAALERGAGIVRTDAGLATAAATVAELRRRYADVQVTDTSRVHNTDWAEVIELGAMLDVGEVIVQAAQARRESRGAHQRDGYGLAPEASHTLALSGAGPGPVVQLTASAGALALQAAR
ncbi:FAD-binding protein [Bogoriella caseilytica]|uniref:succinate dehydrogenase n=1 Tax=Bogoriella caseilytica TaxID=56055 RepID=A0A3N2B9N4_9MICO|nr:FAD-binding protein [Bogoriella caseilytica]ROR71979.1 fumarate reductase flavoprotein subunit [Bogoriella caseilytica]